VRSDKPDEPVDLTSEQRRRIDGLFERLQELDDHGVIGVAPGTDAVTIRRAYYQRVAEFHPDRFFRKAVGSYREKIDAIQRRVTEAYERLSSKENRAPAADRTRQPAPPRPAAALPTGPTPEQARQALRRQLDARHSEAKRLFDEGVRAAAHGDRVGAAEAYRKASMLSPNDPVLAAAHADARREASAVASDAYFRQAEMEEQFGHWAEAARSWRRVTEARPGDAHARERLANALLEAARRGSSDP
jgi:curved DNA-binding protein CbpA